LKNKNLPNFNDNVRKPFFEKLVNVVSVDLSKNSLVYIDDIMKIKSIRMLDISLNKIADLAFTEQLVNLEVFIANNNAITSISSLSYLKLLRVLDVSKNKIAYNTSTMKALSNMKSLKELSIADNPVNIDFYFW
jgi:hypothetical protein